MSNGMFSVPSYEEAERCLDLRRRCKRGERISREDTEFVSFMYRMFGTWYRNTEKQVFNETVPFGSNAHRE